MNPLDFSGPQFLLFYSGLIVAVMLAIHWLKHRRENTMTAGAVTLTDPYEIAFLRGGAAEMARIAVVHLIEKGALKVVGKEVMSATGAAADHPLEQAVLTIFTAPMEPNKCTTHSLVKDVGERYRTHLAARGLAPDNGMVWARWQRVFAGWLVLWLLAFAKLDVAAERGKVNTGFLIVLMVVGVIALLVQAAWRTHRTEAGARTVETAKRLFDRNAVPGTAAEAAMLAAVFGVGVMAEPDYRKLFPRASEGGCGGGGSSCGGSCGGGCGGGGCGGCGGD